MRGTYRLRQFYRRLRARYLLARALRAVKRSPLVDEPEPHGLDAPLVVTLTSYPPRFGDLSKTLRSLLDQQVAADRVELWIADGDADSLPADVRMLEKHGLSIKLCRDLRSYKKLVPALESDPLAFYVTADDDVYYPPDWLGNLVRSAKAHPGCIITTRAHLAFRTTEGAMMPYTQWQLATDQIVADEDDALLFPTGVGGILYPPHGLCQQVFDEDQFMKLCPRGDDIWFFWMARQAGTGHRRTSEWFDIVEWPHSQDIALYNDNLHAEGNDQQIRAMEAHFGHVPGRLQLPGGAGL